MRRQDWMGALLLALGALRIGYAQVLRPVLETSAASSQAGAGQIDLRYQGLAPLLARIPLDAPLAYRALGAPDDLARARRFGQASYALAPRVLVPDDGRAGWLLLDLERAGDQVQAGAGVQIVGRSRGGLVLLGRRDARGDAP